VYTTISGDVPQEFALGANYPNPFNPTTKISFGVAKSDNPMVVSLKVYDLLGREVKTLVNEPMQPGSYYVEWDGTNHQGLEVTSGVYLVRMTAGEFVATRRMTLMR
jgi:flagellar hook assembly protein FlgD